ncbi:MAG: hypothetical protein ACRC35_14475 [Angustibacter sp.]
MTGEPAPEERSTSSALSHPQVAEQAIEILARAQRHADSLVNQAAEAANRMRSEADTESRKAREQAGADAAALSEETTAKRAEIEQLHGAAHTAARDAERRCSEAGRVLASAQEEAHTIVADATEQASLTLESADRTSDELVATARTDTERQRALSQQESDRRHRDAEAVWAVATAAAADITRMTTELAAQRSAEHREREQDRRASYEITSSTQHAELKTRIEQLLSQAEADADRHRELARSESERAHADLVARRDETDVELSELLAQAQRDADAKITEADEQVAWARRTVEELLTAAKAEATRIQQHSEQAGVEHLNAARQQAEHLLAAAEADHQQRTAEHERVVAQLVAEAEDALRSAHQEADAHRAKVAGEAERLAQDAAERERLADERAERRLAEAEAGARGLRERAADNLSRAQVEAHMVRRNAREEAGRMVTGARAEADQLRTRARRLLDEARGQVTTLVDRREAIERELGSLSGVIEALAVPEFPDDHPDATRAEGADPTADTAHADPPPTRTGVRELPDLIDVRAQHDVQYHGRFVEPSPSRPSSDRQTRPDSEVVKRP